MFSNLLKAAVLSAAVVAPGVASAAANAIVTTDLNMRAGPSTGYQRVATIPGGDNVIVHGCVNGFDWCDISWAGARGWVSSNYLAYLDGGRRRSIASFGVTIGLPTVGFDRNDYYRRHHGGWHHDRRDRDHGRDRGDRRGRDRDRGDRGDHDWNGDRGNHDWDRDRRDHGWDRDNRRDRHADRRDHDRDRGDRRAHDRDRGDRGDHDRSRGNRGDHDRDRDSRRDRDD